MPRAVRPFAVAAARRPEFPVETVSQERVVVRCRFEDDAAARPAVPTGWPASRHELFSSEGNTTVAAISGFHVDFGFIYEHVIVLIRIRYRRRDLHVRIGWAKRKRNVGKSTRSAGAELHIDALSSGNLLARPFLLIGTEAR
jgi:hypothetical protein